MQGLAFSTNAFKRNTLEEAIDAIAACGYAGVELMADVPHLRPTDTTHADVEQILQQLQARRLSLSNVNAFTGFFEGDTYHPSWIEADSAKVELRVDHTLASVRLARDLGAKTVSLQPGGPMIGQSISRENALMRFAEHLVRCVEEAELAGVTLAIEPAPGLLIQTADEFVDFKERYFDDAGAVKLNCDVGHFYCVGEDPAGVIRRMPELIAHVHLNDIQPNRVHQHHVPGAGAIDFDAVFHALHDVGYQGWATVELHPFETSAAEVAQQAIEHLRPLIARHHV